MADNGKEAERRRLAEALRANLKRRKVAGRAAAARPREPAGPDERDATPSVDGKRG